LNPGITERTAERDLKSLADLNVVKIEGTTKARHYVWVEI
jgi:hypothetical protein